MTAKWFILAIALIIALSMPTLAKPWDVQVGIETLSPTGDFWTDHAEALEVKGIYWFEPVDSTDVGMGLSIGLSQWQANDQLTQYTLAGNSGSRQWHGDLQQIPLGLSLLNRVELTDTLNGTLELGMRYVFCSSDLVMTRTSDNGFGGTLSQDFNVDCDNGVVGRIGGTLHWNRTWKNRPMEIIFSGGYQFDLNQGIISGENFTETEAQDLELGAFYLGIGIVCPF